MKIYTKLSIAVLLGTVLLASFGANARAQNTVQEPVQLTASALKDMIDGMGYPFKEDMNDKGQPVRFILTVASNNRDWALCVEISPNKENVWLYANLAKVPDANSISRNVLFDMLKANEAIGPSYFAFDARQDFFVMYHPLTNRGVTPKLLRSRLDFLASQVSKYANLWEPNAGSVTSDPVGPSPAVQKLIQSLGNTDELVRLKAAKDLGKLGASAKAAVPALQKLLQDPDEDVRRVAASAIDRIQGGSTQPPSPPSQATSVAGSTWEGTECLAGFSKLTFRLESGGKAVMIDASSTVNGTWVQNGNQVTITFQNCVYRGTIQGQVLAGSARFTVGEPREWSFSVTQSGPPQTLQQLQTRDGWLGAKPLIGYKSPRSAMLPARR